MKKFVVLFMLFMSLLAGCAEPQGRAEEAIAKVPVPDKVNFYEREQVALAEELNDQSGRVFFWYVLSYDGRLMAQFTCVGRPNSSTESLEPNEIHNRYYSSGNDYGFQVQLEGDQTAYSFEAMGMDGTYGEPVAFRYCVTPEGHYVDISQSFPSMVSTTPLTFDAPEVRFNEEMEAKKLLAEQAIREGGCVDSTLNVIDCEVRDNNLHGGGN